jgi:predicted Rossmann fold nucleotide-binding protein DprA/Smf involved in DNA uptake
MSTPRSQSPAAGSPPRRFVLARRNLIILALALVVLVVGYLTLRAGHPSTAAVILVLGYCILFPLGIAL